MIKLFVKGVIFVMGIQSLFGRLQDEGIVKGSIEINYPVLQEKVISIIRSDEFKNLVKKINDSEVTDYVSPPEAQAGELINCATTVCTVKDSRFFKHIVRRGETLSNLAQYYGVSWKVIKKINRIDNARYIYEGQNLIIPNLMQV